MILYLNIIFESICLFFALFTLTREKSAWMLFIPYLLAVVLIESFGMYAALNHVNSNWAYNSYVLIYFVFIQTILFRICNLYGTRSRLFWLFLVLFSTCYLAELIYYDFSRFTQNSIILANILITSQCLYYFYRLLQQDKFVQLKTHAPFWVVTGLLIHAFGSTTSLLFYEYLVAINVQLNIPVRQIIFLFLNFILYSSWSYAFVCKYQQRTLS